MLNSPGNTSPHQCLVFQIKDTRSQLKAQAQSAALDGHEDPDSRMDTDRERISRTKGGKTKGTRSGGKAGFWQK